MITFSSKIEKDVLNYYFLHPEKKHHLHALARILSADPSNLNRKLQSLTKIGLFKVKKQGNQSIYALNKSYFLFDEYESIIKKTIGIESELKNILMRVPGVRKAYLFGSYVKGDMDQHSDIDLLIIGHQNSLSLSKKLTALEKKIGREINAVEVSEAEFNQKKEKDAFLKYVFKQKVIPLTP